MASARAGAGSCPSEFPYIVTNTQYGWQDGLCFNTAEFAAASTGSRGSWCLLSAYSGLDRMAGLAGAVANPDNPASMCPGHPASETMALQSGVGLCSGPSTDFNAGADLPSGYSLHTGIGYRRCSAADNDVENCKLDCLSSSACNSMSHNGNCCFLYESSTCPPSTHSAASGYSTYFKTQGARARARLSASR